MKSIMFHSIGNGFEDWNRSYLSVSLNHFEKFCRYLKKNKYQTLFIDEWYKLQDKNQNISRKQILLTFDDGYLDNWSFVYPLLKKYSLKGTVFVNPEFVDPRVQKRKNLDDVGFNEKKLHVHDKLGFLNWAEIKEMDKSEFIDIQSHSMSHNWFFKSNKIVDLYHGQDNYDWLAWIEKPERKSYYMNEDQKKFVPYGYPVFEYDRALSLRRYFPDDRIIDEGQRLFSKYKNQAILSDDSKNKILSTLNNLVQHKYPGYFETDEEMGKRYEYELIESKRILEEKLNKRVEFLCWPGGGYNELALKISKQAGYKVSTLASRESIDNINNTQQYKRLHRFGMGSFIYKNGKRIPAKLSNHLILSFHAKSGNYWAKIPLIIQKILS